MKRKLIRKKCDRIVNTIIDILNKEKLTFAELLFVLGNLSFMIGTTMKYQGKKTELTIQEALKAYVEEPGPATGLITMGATILSDWLQSLYKISVIDDQLNGGANDSGEE